MKFFVYIHRRASNNKIFYVGKGCRRRHKSLNSRSQHWKNIVKKHGYTIEIVKDNLTEKEAFELEIELIEKYKSEGLCNKTRGGEGTFGYTFTEEQRAKHKAIMSKEENRKRNGEQAKIRFQNPEFRRKHKEIITNAVRRPEFREKARRNALKQFSDQRAIELARKNSLIQFSNPEMVEKIRKKAIERFDTPEKRAKHAQAKAVKCIQNGLVFGTTTLAAEWLSSQIGKKTDNSFIAAACRGKHKVAYGLNWEYVAPTKEEAIP